jgi:hypothetical protein
VVGVVTISHVGETRGQELGKPVNPAQKYEKLYFFSKNEVYATFNGETCVYTHPCILLGNVHVKKYWFLKNPKEVKGNNVCKRTGKGQTSHQCICGGN